MIDEQNTIDTCNPPDEIMISEFNRTSTLFLDNEQLGERRLQIFITLVSAISTLLGLTNIIPGSKDKITIYYFGLFVLWVLFTFGIVTLRRVIQRNVIADTYKYSLDKIRLYFITNDETRKRKVLRSIWLYVQKPENIESIEDIEPAKRRSNKVGWRLGNGGILETVRILNGYLIGLIAVLTFVLGLFLYSPNSIGMNLINPWYILWSIVIFVVGFFICQQCQINYIRTCYKKEEDDAEKANKIRYE